MSSFITYVFGAAVAISSTIILGGMLGLVTAEIYNGHYDAFIVYLIPIIMAPVVVYANYQMLTIIIKEILKKVRVNLCGGDVSDDKPSEKALGVSRE